MYSITLEGRAPTSLIQNTGEESPYVREPVPALFSIQHEEIRSARTAAAVGAADGEAPQ
jgi:hypothetical protein